MDRSNPCFLKRSGYCKVPHSSLLTSEDIKTLLLPAVVVGGGEPPIMSAFISLGSSSSFIYGEAAVGYRVARFASASRLPRWKLATLSYRASVSPKTTVISEDTGPRRPARGITKPKPVSAAMQAFLGVKEISRTQALKRIWAYIKENNLQDPEDKKIVVCDEKLKSILGGRDRVGFLEISGLLNPHFFK